MCKQNKYGQRCPKLLSKISALRYGLGIFSIGLLSSNAYSAIPDVRATNVTAIVVKNTLQQAITGTVVDSSGLPLAGANIVEKGTSNGTQTDFDGNFSLNVSNPDAVLVVSYIGFKSTEVPITESSTLNIVLQEDAEGLDEVVVVGYQNKEKANLTGSVAVIDKEVLQNRPTNNLSTLLPGLAAGVSVALPNPGRIGQNTDNRNIRIGALATRNTPGVLVIIDGVQASINSINPNDVESISILRDAEAAIYGSRASEGVIVITTKRGGKPSIEASINTSIAIPNIHPEKSTTIEYMNYLKEGWELSNSTPLWRFPQVFQYMEDNKLTSESAIKDGNFAHEVVGAFPDTPYMLLGGNSNWYDIIYNNAMTYTYDLNVSGSSDKLNYYASLRTVDQGSMLRFGTNENQTYFGRLKVDYTHNEKFKFGANIGITTNNLKEPTNYEAAQNVLAGRASFDHPYTPEGRYMSWNAAPNPIGLFKDGGNREAVTYRLNPQLYATYTPISGLDITGRFTKTFTGLKSRSILKSFRTYYLDEAPGVLNAQQPQTNVSVSNVFDQTFIGNLTASYKTSIGNNHTVRALLGVSHEEFIYDTTNAWRRNLVYDQLPSLVLGDSEEQFNNDVQSEISLKSLFGNLSYSFKDRYTVEGTFRRDGSSRFAQGFKYDSFFSLGGAWNVSNENFIKNLDFSALNSLKLRASWGQLGNQGSIGVYSFASTLSLGTGVLLGAPGAVAPAQVATLGRFPNLDATWEAADKTNFGLDATLFNNRLSLEGNYFITETKNAFFTKEYPSILGAPAPQINGANFKATGWIASVGWNDRLGKDFSYNARFNISDANTEVITLADSPVVGYGYNAFVEGNPLGSVYGYQFEGLVEDEADLTEYYENITGGITTLLRPGDAKYADLDGDGILEGREYKEDEDGNPTEDSGDLINLGDTEKHYEYNFNLGLNYKNFNFSALLIGVGKWTVFDQTPVNYSFPWVQPYEHYIDNYWTPTRTNGHYPRPSVVNGSFNNAVQGNNYVFSDASYMKRNNAYLLLKNVQLGYTFPKVVMDKLNMNKIQLYVNASDVGFLVNNMPKSYNPESPYNANLTPYPITVSLGLNLNF
ncbi:SusC/RagA family TonB-linked outer membrane protein [Cytophaga sp. FL35]|uniref:SusC/RagA family TonB-linked outer membrane protein n=1 Tax=Cytophaga sp. FL35 TaxID=1904456 RepID=UPI001653EA1C|nr:SusC/RagA family TonB-linked outer membrane protein [Cytophaga sp. FL35]MBC6999827.1 SusC/RagA family TonB-linked outer membrane protein [Cytophaga sp. FL35]